MEHPKKSNHRIPSLRKFFIFSSSLEAVTEKKRISAGEYFGLRSENLGLFDADSPVPPRESLRPNFGHEIHSPTRARGVPLVEMSQRLSDGSLDKVPTKDTGLDRPSLNSLDFTFDSSVVSNRKVRFGRVVQVETKLEFSEIAYKLTVLEESTYFFSSYLYSCLLYTSPSPRD